MFEAGACSPGPQRAGCAWTPLAPREETRAAGARSARPRILPNVLRSTIAACLPDGQLAARLVSLSLSRDGRSLIRISQTDSQ